MKKELIKSNLIRSNKKSQYYLIAAVMIVTILLGASIVTNYAVTREEPVKFYDLSEELKQESSRIIDYGIYNEKDIAPLIEDFAQNYFITYAEQKEKDVDFVFIYGNKGEIKTINYIEKNLDMETLEETEPGKVKVDILGKTYNFELNEGENFLFIITKEQKGERYVSDG